MNIPPRLKKINQENVIKRNKWRNKEKKTCNKIRLSQKQITNSFDSWHNSIPSRIKKKMKNAAISRGRVTVMVSRPRRVWQPPGDDRVTRLVITSLIRKFCAGINRKYIFHRRLLSAVYVNCIMRTCPRSSSALPSSRRVPHNPTRYPIKVINDGIRARSSNKVDTDISNFALFVLCGIARAYRVSHMPSFRAFSVFSRDKHGDCFLVCTRIYQRGRRIQK